MAEFTFTGTLRIDGRARVSHEIIVELNEAFDAALSRIPPLYVERGRNVNIEIGPVHLFERQPMTADTLDLAALDLAKGATDDETPSLSARVRRAHDADDD